MAVIGNAPFQGLVSGGNILDASIEGVDLSTSAIAARLGYTPVDPGAAAITGGTINSTTIGATTAATGAFTTLAASAAVTLNSLTASTALALDASKNVVSVTNTGSGNNVLATSPTLVTPVLGTPTSGNFSTGTFTWPTFNQNTTGTAAGLSATLATASGGTGLTAFTANGVVYASSTSALATGSALTFDGTTLTATGTSPIKVAYVSAPSQFTTVNYDGLSVSGAQDAYYIAPSGRTQFWYLGAAEQMRLSSTGLSVTGNINITSPAFTDSIATINSTSTNVSQRLNFTANGTLQTQIYDDSTETRISAVTTKSLAFRTDNAERLRITSIGQFSLAYAGFQIQSPAGSLSFPQGASLQTGGFGRAWNPAQQIGQGANAGLYGMASTYLAYYDAGWKSLGGGTASAITIDEGNFSFSNTNGVSATNSALTWTTRMFINTSGNIGMGTVDPAGKLDVLGSSNRFIVNPTYFTGFSAGLSSYTKRLYGGAVVDEFSYIGDMYYENSYTWKTPLTSYSATAYGGGATIFYGGTGVTANVAFTPAERARIDSVGNFLIGTSSTPGTPTKLVVASTSYPSTGDILANFIAGTTSPTSERYVQLFQTYTGAAFDSPMLAFRANANGSNLSSFGTIRTTYDGAIVFSNISTTNSAISAASEKVRIDSTGQLTFLNSSNFRVTGIKASGFGYSAASYGALVLGSPVGGSFSTVCIGVDPASNPSGSFTGHGFEVMFRNYAKFITPNGSDNGFHSYITMYDGFTKVSAAGLQIYADSAGSSPPLIFGGETGAPKKGIFLESFFMVYQGHNNEGHKFRTVDAVGTANDRLIISGTGDCTFVTPTAAVRVNNGTTAQRPTPVAGAMRWNTSLAQLEVGDGTSFEKVLVDTVVTSATGGSVIEDGDYKVHTFTSSGTFTLTSVSGGGKADVQVLVIGGGGGGGFYLGGGGGSGAMLETQVSMGTGSYTVTVGAGGAAVASGFTYSGNGTPSSILGGLVALYALGGGAGGNGAANDAWGANGNASGSIGSGGGGGSPYGFTLGSGTLHASFGGPAGLNGSGGGFGTLYSGFTFNGGGGGGGALGAGVAPNIGNGPVGAGGFGGSARPSSITGSVVSYAGGGGGGYGTYLANQAIGGGTGGGYGVGSANSGATLQATSGTTNLGGGGGGGQLYSGYQQGGAGGSGVVIIRYKFR